VKKTKKKIVKTKSGSLPEFIGDRMKKMRTEREMSQQQFAKKAGISMSFVSMLERGDRLPSLDMLVTISKVFEVRLQDMVGGF
jgi:transcriptional regulator with XRE-family HTH domain